tara:strand:- start:2795 stop:3592 length:798 start_codon:yes stop_codon:yes gene_type:complete
MLTALGLVSTLTNGASTFFGWFLKYPREMAILVMGIYIVFCQITHNGPLTVGGECSQGQTGDTISDIITETFIFDSSKVVLDVSEPTSILEEKPESPITWERPILVMDTSATCSDSIMELTSSLRWYDLSLSECEQRLLDISSFRTYKDSSRNDTMVVGYEFKVRGELIGSPELWYKRTAPWVSTHRETTVLEVRGPYRKIGIGAGLGPHFKQGKTIFRGMEATLNIAYLDKKNNALKFEAGWLFQQDPGWALRVGYTKYFDLKF